MLGPIRQDYDPPSTVGQPERDSLCCISETGVRRMSKLRVPATLKAGASLAAFLFASPVLAQEDPAAGDRSSDIVVTATKRDETLRNVAASISAVTEESLDRLNAQSLADYITRVPGVVFNDYQPGVSEVVIRGIASTSYHEANQSTTGYYLNQIPLTEPGFPLVIPDIDTFDLSRSKCSGDRKEHCSAPPRSAARSTTWLTKPIRPRWMPASRVCSRPRAGRARRITPPRR
jgi:hypothetical protein